MILNTYESKNSRLVTGTKTKVETRIKKEKNKSSSSAIANLQTKTIHIRNAELFKITLSTVSKVFSYLLLLLLSVLFLLFILILHNTARRLLRRWGNSRERLRKENTLKCFSTRRRPAGRGCRSSLVWRTPSSLWNHTQQTVTSSSCAMRSPPSNWMNLWWWRCFSYLKVCTSGTSLRLWPLILWTSLAAAFIIFSTLFSCCCSSRVWREQKQRVFIPAGQLYCDSKKRKKAPSGGLSVSSAHWEQTRTQTLISPCNTWTEAPREAWTLGGKFTCFSACLRSSRKRSSSWTQAGSSFWPCCLAFSSCVFSSRSTRSSCASRACRVRDTCRSSSRSREVRSSPSRPLTGTGGWERMKGRG